jgi:hypothetical protein
MISENLIISVYKTSISEKDLIGLKPVMDSFHKIDTWSTDLEDCENILRIESQYAIEKDIISMLHAFNIECIELE